MADNYLENKMEEHRRAKSTAPLRTARAAKTMPPHSMVWSFPQLRVVVDDAAAPAAAEIIDAFRKIDAKVDFGISTSVAAGREMAQRTGARFHPESSLTEILTRTVADRGAVDILVICSGRADAEAMRMLAARPDTGYSPRIIWLGQCNVSIPEGIHIDHISGDFILDQNRDAAALAAMFLAHNSRPGRMSSTLYV